MFNLAANILSKFQSNQTEIALPIKKFVIIAAPRTGSNYLCSILNTHSDILCHHELFHADKIYYARNLNKDKIDLGTIAQRDRSPKRFIQKIWQQEFNSSAIGFKLLSGQNPKAFNLVIKDKSIKKVLLSRQDLLRTYASLLIAKKTDVWSVEKSTSKSNSQVSVEVDINSFHNYIEKTHTYYQELRTKLKSSKQSFLDITYEDLVGCDRDRVRTEILEFIEVDALINSLQETHKKQNSNKLQKLISNFTEIESQLKGTELESYLDFCN